ncbi:MULTISPECIES: hypothetical protein [unclassified Bradyrhizobium]|uniref:hypothetical protein n=1 Tax=unclassified Bradyrhizobium TaxID=2631580 RepID=UPI00247A9370|nr:MULTISPECIES: hypothetical protein [unclassified Bradyrhizobium]WGR67829.1 hypothetical protein MTX24_20385 [Bradyrhizobium sp. ISRA426]WGR79882.1 hypothetical protein MTX21_05500 [Bradyrhizobium sp. ISRA430]WGR83068.1 hypothetical protein MTX25_20065 [Bradyrhizobium sp. ISRA432]
MKKRKPFPEVQDHELDIAFQWVRALLDALAESPLKTDRERYAALVTLKKAGGILTSGDTLAGNRPKGELISPVDAAVIADEERYGSLRKAVAAHVAAGKLSRHTQENSHYLRILGLRNGAKTKIKRKR